MKLLLLVQALAGVLVLGEPGQYRGNSDAIVFPGPAGRRTNQRAVQPIYQRDRRDPSLKLARDLSAMQSVDEFLDLVQGVPPELMETGIALRMAGTEERSNAEKPEPARCKPELQAVPLKNQDDLDPSRIYFPSCTRVKRCGGCCSHSLLSCQPTASIIRNFEVIVTSINADAVLTYQGKEIVPIEEHTKCKCDCRTKEEHCNEKQEYISDECRCACMNVDEENKCHHDNRKLWDPQLCSCLCRVVEECSTGFYFDQKTCSCREVPISRGWFSDPKSTGYRFRQTEKPEDTPIIVTLDANDSRRKPKEDPA